VSQHTEEAPISTTAERQAVVSQPGITPGAERLLMAAAWPGNVRELRNVIERACMLVEGDMLTEQSLAGPFGAAMVAGPSAPPCAAAAPLPQAQPAMVAGSLDQMERDHVVRVIEAMHGNKQLAAARLGVSRRALYRLLERHGLDRYVQRRPGPCDRRRDAAGESAADEVEQWVRC